MAKWIIMLVALLGLGLGIWTVSTSRREVPEPPPASPPSVNPFPVGIAASGLVEASTRNIAIAAPQAGLVIQVFVKVNDKVHQGQPLFELDSRLLQAQLVQAKAAATTAQAKLAQLEAAPRPVSVPPLEAATQAAVAQAKLAKAEYELTQQVYAKNAATQEELERRRYVWQAAEAQATQAQANLQELKAGTWEKDITIAKAQVDQAHADIQAITEQIARLTVRSPINGTVLKRRIEPGEYTVPGSGAMSAAAMVVGDIATLNVRAQVDEEDTPRLRFGAQAVARVRGPLEAQLPLKMLRIEPLAEPKRQLTGVSTELVDTRVVEVVLQIENTKGIPLYAGQIVDVFFNAAPPEVSKASGPATQPAG